ncbi:MAG: CsbD family protein [Terriglobales bacterium]
MNKDRVEGKMKDVAGRVERQAGEWTDNEKMQVHGTAKQAEGKVQNAVGKVKDAGKDALKRSQAEQEEDADIEKSKERRRNVA